MMLAKDNSNPPDNLQYMKVLTPQVTLVADQQEAANPERRARPGAAFGIRGGVNGNFNLGFATRKGALQGQRRQFSCAIPLHHIFGFC